MIIFEQGRPKSVKNTKQMIVRVVNEYNSLSEEEKQVLRFLLADSVAVDKGLKEQKLLDLVKRMEYDEEPVPPEKFLFDEYYLGRYGRQMYPKLVDDFIEFFENDYYMAIVTGGIGCGKSFWVSCCLARILYELCCLRNPQASLGLGAGSVISLVNMSVTERLARKVIFETFGNILAESPYFKDKFERTLNELRFDKNIWVAPVTSSDSSVLGLNVYTCVIDESNFLDMNPKHLSSESHKVYSKAEVLFYTLMRRMKSRFVGGKRAGYLFLVSSVRQPDDFTLKICRELKDDEGVFVRSYAVDEVKPILLNSPKFEVLVGNERVQSVIITPENKKEVETIKLREGDGVFVVSVADEFRADFERDIEGALRDIKGIVVASHRPYLQREKIVNIIKQDRVHPFTVEVWDSQMGAGFVWDALVRDGRPIVNPGVPRHVHIDLGIKRDSSGIAVGHIYGYKNVERFMGEGKINEALPIIYIDFVLKVEPPERGEIEIALLRKLVYDLYEHGYPIGLVTMDSFQSADSIQAFIRYGFQAKVLSVEGLKVYETLKSAIYEERLMVYYYEPLLKELRELEFDPLKKKVDHPKTGSKDVADAVAGVVYTLSEKQEQLVLPPLTSDKSKDIDLREVFVIGQEEKTFNEEEDYRMNYLRFFYRR